MTEPRARARRLARPGARRRGPNASHAPASRRPRATVSRLFHRGSRSPQRLVVAFVVLMLGFGAMGARLVVLQVVESPSFARLATRQREVAVPLPARRGAIFDRNGESLALSVDLQMIYADPELVRDPAAEAERLAEVLGRPAEELAEALEGDPGSRFEYVARRVDPEIAGAVEDLELAGLFMRPEPKRFYPNERIASQLLGFVGTDGVGLAGLESQYEDVLAGDPGRMRLEQDPAGRPLPQADFSYDRPRGGRSLYLTIDKDIQYRVQAILADAAARYHAEAATAVVMRPDSGEVLAMANFPDFNPNHFGESAEENYKNRAVSDVYEPGSSYKIVTAAAALETGVVTPRTAFTVPDEFPYEDRVFHDSHYHETERMTVADIIEQSSNIGMIKIGLRLGGARLDRYVREFGFGSPSGLGFPGESRGIVLDRDQWSGTTIATIPIGQGIAVTAIQMASAFATLANGGVRVEPTLVAATVDPSGRASGPKAPERSRVVSQGTTRKMTRMLTNVVGRGTGIEAQVPGYVVAGKTGTAQKPLPTGGYGNHYTASFAGYAPAEDPEMVAIVVLDDPRPIWGGATAAPTFSSIADYALRRLGVPPSTNARRAAAELEAASEGVVDPHD